MSGRILVLGAAGRVGRRAAEAFRDAGWEVASLVRGASADHAAPGTQVLEVDARDAESVADAARGMDVVLHALNPPYTEWAMQVPLLAEAAIAAARASNATLVLPGNVYNYGADMPAVLDENTPMHPTSRKGALRVALEERLREAGIRTIVLRAGDFFGGGSGGSWFDRVIIRYVDQKRLTYPGPLEVVHEWAYLPDLVAAMVPLVEARAQFNSFERFGFCGHAVTGAEFTGAIMRTLRRDMTIGTMPWWLLRMIGPVVPTFGELAEMSYLWETPHRIDGRKLKAAIGAIPRTPLDTAIATSLEELGLLKRP
ncbi:MAG TPA: NAD-dependent epimerase/dehydratase family protein [Xanthobacteraceae bacterium]|nr:NAD-dependent epimerase/dehydratase family protein [Xanthobacteraceae bacterium]